MILTATPAYGRDYTSRREAQAAWARGDDFQAQPCGRYFSIRDLSSLREQGVRWINLRYKCLSQVHVIQVGA